MGPRDVRNSFDRMFDFNRDGKLDACEQAAQFDYLEQEEMEIERELGNYDAEDDDFEDDYEDSYDFDDDDM